MLGSINPQHIPAQILLRSWPFPRGAGRLLDRFFSRLRFDQQITRVRTTDDFEITVTPNELIGRHLYLTGEFDRSIVEILLNFSEPSDAFLDIGANIGYVSCCFLHNVPGSHVTSVEPQPDVLPILEENLKRFGRYQVYPFAVSDHDGETSFEINQENKGAGRIVRDEAADKVKIPLRSGKSLFNDMRINRLDLVKIDAEGAEEAIITSCIEYFYRLQPRAVVFEDNNRIVNGPIGKLLESAGYTIYGIRKSLRSLSLVSTSSSFACHDYIAVSSRRPIPTKAIETYEIPAYSRKPAG